MCIPDDDPQFMVECSNTSCFYDEWYNYQESAEEAVKEACPEDGGTLTYKAV